MDEKVLIKALRPFLPQIKSKAGSAFDTLYNSLLDEAEKDLRIGEDYAAVMIVRKEECCYLVSCAMSEDNRVLRKIAVRTTQDFTNELLNQLL